MEKVQVLSSNALVDGWIEAKYLAPGEDKYSKRNLQAPVPTGGWRHLTSDEIERLIKNENKASSWDTIWVTDEFSPKMLKNNHFYGTVRIGRVMDGALKFHDLRLPIGITNSSIHSCDIGDDCAIHDVHYLSHYIIGSRCMLFNIQEMSTTDHSKFGNGIIKDGEEEDVRVVVEVMNETGCRGVYPFDGMNTADAYLWAKYIDDTILQKRLGEITQNSFDSHRGYYGTIGDDCVIKTSEIIKDVKVGPACYIKGASKLKNITINSSEQEPSQIGENVILVNGIVGYGSRIFYGCTAVKFVIGTNCNLKYGARVINSIMGDNSTISCCEVLNNLIFPAHEQHHNNSFLIAACIKGQSNMAAGATIGSNHNSRSTDNELVAGRGFWPGLCSNVKHSSVFASYTLLAKGSYQYELNIPLPFCMISNNEKEGRLEVMPAYWWMYNMYSLARNNWKFQTRDKRKTKIQNIEFDTFAPDSMEEVLQAREILREWVGKAAHKAGLALENESPYQTGLRLLESDKEAEVEALDVLGEGMEKSRRPERVRHAYRAYKAYGDMLIHYAMDNVMKFVRNMPGSTLADVAKLMKGERVGSWVNLGGQIMSENDVDALRDDIRTGALNSWEAIHARYNTLWDRYPVDKLRHSLFCMADVFGVESLDAATWEKAIAEEKRIQEFMRDQVRASRMKDMVNPFRRATYRNEQEMIAAVGTIDDNSFVKQVAGDTAKALEQLSQLKLA